MQIITEHLQLIMHTESKAAILMLRMQCLLAVYVLLYFKCHFSSPSMLN